MKYAIFAMCMNVCMWRTGGAFWNIWYTGIVLQNYAVCIMSGHHVGFDQTIFLRVHFHPSLTSYIYKLWLNISNSVLCHLFLLTIVVFYFILA